MNKKQKKNRWVSNKISKLVDEGKSHDQAVAQALSMAEDIKFQGGGRQEVPTINFSTPNLPSYYTATVVSNPNVVPTETIDGKVYEVSRLGTLHPQGSLVPTEFGAVAKDSPMLKNDRGTLQTLEISENKANPNRSTQSLFELNRGWIVDEKGNRTKKVDIGDYSKYYNNGGTNMYKDGGELPKFQVAGMFNFNPQTFAPTLQEQLSTPTQSYNSIFSPMAYPYAANNSPQLGSTPQTNTNTVGTIDFVNSDPNLLSVRQGEANAANQPDNTTIVSDSQLGMDEQQPVVQSVTDVMGSADLTKQGNVKSTIQDLAQKQASQNGLTTTQTPNFNTQQPYQFFNPYGGVDIPSRAVFLGQAIENKNTAGIVTGALGTGLGVARNIFGGMGQARVRNESLDNYYDQQRSLMIGENDVRALQEGGQIEQQQPNPEQIVQGIAQALQQGVQPEDILQQLVQSGISQEEATQLIQMVMQQMQGQPQQQESQPQMKCGGKKYKNGGEVLADMVGKKIKNYSFNKETNSYDVEFE